MSDDRFKKMFQDKEFEIDKNTEAYRLLKSGNVNKKVKEEDVDSVGEGSQDDEPAAKGRDLNKLFEGRGDQGSEPESAEQSDDDDFQAKMSKKQRKNYKKQKGKDRILLSKPQPN